jgi:hypothetical protein
MRARGRRLKRPHLIRRQQRTITRPPTEHVAIEHGGWSIDGRFIAALYGAPVDDTRTTPPQRRRQWRLRREALAVRASQFRRRPPPQDQVRRSFMSHRHPANPRSQRPHPPPHRIPRPILELLDPRERLPPVVLRTASHPKGDMTRALVYLRHRQRRRLRRRRWFRLVGRVLLGRRAKQPAHDRLLYLRMLPGAFHEPTPRLVLCLRRRKRLLCIRGS